MRDVVIMFMETHYAPFGDLLDTIRTDRANLNTADSPLARWR